MKNLTILIIIAAFLTGCVTLGLMPSVCDEPAATESWICAKCAEYNVQAEDVDLIIRIVAVKALKKQSHRDAVSRVLDEIEATLSSSITYRAIMHLVEGGLSGPEAELISRRLGMFDSTRLISSFDKMLILKHIANLRVILQ